MENIRDTQYFDCACYSSEHTLKFNYERNDEDPFSSEIYTTVYIGCVETFWRRLWKFIKFLFGYRCRHGDFDCFCMRAEDIDRLMYLLDAWKKDINSITPSWSSSTIINKDTDVKGLFDMYIGRRVKVVLSGTIDKCGYFCEGEISKTDQENVVLWDWRKQARYKVPYSSVIQVDVLRF